MRFVLPILLLGCLLAAGCGGGGTAASPSATPAVATVVTASTLATSAPIGASSNGYAATIGFPPLAAGSASFSAEVVPAQPATTPVLQSIARVSKSIGATSITPLVFLTLMPAATTTFTATPSFTITFPAGTGVALGSSVYMAIYDPTNASTGWSTYAGPGAVSGQTITFASIGRSITFNANVMYTFAVFATISNVTVPSPTPTCPFTLGQPEPLCPATAFTPGPAVSPFPIASATTMYVSVSVTNVPGVTSELLAIPLPLTASSTATRVATAEWPGALAVDSLGRLFAQSYLQNHVTIDVFATPVTAQSTPLFSFPRPANLFSMLFDGSGDLIGVDFSSGFIEFWAPPFGAQSLPAHEAAPNGVQPSSLAAAGQRLFYSIQNIEQFLDPPYVNGSALFGVAGVSGVIEAQSVDAAGEFIVAYRPGFNGGGSGLLVFPTPPTSAANTPSVSLTLPSPAGPGTASASVLAYDNQGRLVVGANYCPTTCSGSAFSLASELLVYTLPLTNASTPTIIPLTAYESVMGIAAGP